ncbi:fibronectin-binding SSURE repeat-containing protein [Ligilactobacillus salivarius]|uniref:SSURE domain-containing protein n=1 Tax=Ligilactobacillus salivarius TaxID=1624 RepID=UPI002551E463|nr:fibronectin-binding SSURE repeat-containing protein [Ligilactobacillus salivarius]MDL1931290.1 fibronectin-binding SSURE repeat-containing protein [Ligilactobacillus salivarius]
MKKSQDNMGNYERYKMYKSGKNWTYSAIAVGMIATGISFTTTNVHADTIKDNIQQSEQISSSKQTEQQSTVSLQTKDNASSKENNSASSTNQSINASNKEVTTASKATNETASELGNRSNIKNNSVNEQKNSANTTNISNDDKAGRITSSLKNEANLKSDSLNRGRNSTSKQDTPNNVTAKVGSFRIDQTKQRNNAFIASKKITNSKQNMLSNSNSGATTKVAINNNDSKKLTNNIKNISEVPAKYLANAKAKGPFTAGVNQVIPFEVFGGDGMLTRLLLNGSEKAAWSDNGTEKNAAILPITGLKAGEYFYEVDLDGNVKGKEGQALLDQLRSNGTKAYDATVKIYGVGADGKADTSKVVATKTGLKINVAGLTSNVKNTIEVPAKYLANAKAKGPFTAGVNQVIPFEAFGGDGMLTRLLLNGSEKAAWSDNGTEKNAAILPINGLKAGEYFYEVDLDGNAKGKEGQALLDQLRSNGTKTYDATVKIYGVGADGKADTSKVVATKTGLRITINVGKNNITTSESKNNITDVQKFTSKSNKEKQSNKISTISEMKETRSGKTNNSLIITNTNVKKADNRRMPDQNNSHILNSEVSQNHSDKMDIQKESMLPQTGEKSNSFLNVIGIALLGLVALVGSVFKLGKKKDD